MTQEIPITKALTAAYAGQNCWDTITNPFSNSGTVCSARGPSGGQCTLRKGHEGPVHIAHLRALNHNYDLGPLGTNEIYRAWIIVDPDLLVDWGL